MAVNERANMNNAGDVPLVKVGHTIGTKYGTNPMEMQKGESKPTEITFGGSGGK